MTGLTRAMACYRDTSPTQQRDLAAAAAALADDTGFPLLVDLRPGLVIIDSGKDQWEDDAHGLELDFTELVRDTVEHPQTRDPAGDTDPSSIILTRGRRPPWRRVRGLPALLPLGHRGIARPSQAARISYWCFRQPHMGLSGVAGGLILGGQVDDRLDPLLPGCRAFRRDHPVQVLLL